jgi:hypothetical protein
MDPASPMSRTQPAADEALVAVRAFSINRAAQVDGAASLTTNAEGVQP